MDFRTRRNNQIFGVRATGLVVQDEKLYLVKSPEGIYYTLGGAIQLGETTEEAVQREMKEEIGIDVEVGPLAFIVENQFTLQEKSYHQIEFLYLVTPLSEPVTYLEEGNSIRQCEWIAFVDLEKLDLNPAFLKTELAKWDGQLKHFMNKDN
ncbi:NUDIX hydrolase [Streptococcus suis]|uniref:NUDIX domain-containing protein n=1 Tax=Streptococcus suis TaxID=1307 RepID=A0ACD5FRL6_STRSU|nr:NUDIX hydrolase [Streptococcus suis]ASW50662.1 NUDIX hydrolase [Streptococcus suis]KPA71856.1 NUDIX hydrolase [Streptococcus suis]NQM46373.1 NUDIX hydrolase [Streptococcus suis]HEL1780021.1 NUDIX hydrolase [Streptococcus suis]HEM2811011.1 NUDIX hydrolase [Streptococcus suis]